MSHSPRHEYAALHAAPSIVRHSPGSLCGYESSGRPCFRMPPRVRLTQVSSRSLPLRTQSPQGHSPMGGTPGLRSRGCISGFPSQLTGRGPRSSPGLMAGLRLLSHVDQTMRLRRRTVTSLFFFEWPRLIRNENLRVRFIILNSVCNLFRYNIYSLSGQANLPCSGQARQDPTLTETPLSDICAAASF